MTVPWPTVPCHFIAQKDITNTFIRENTPNSEDSAVERPAPLRSSESALVTARKKKVKKKRQMILKEKDLTIQRYKQKMENYKKRLQRLEKKANNNSKNYETPNTKLTRMCDTPATRKDVVKKALFGEVLNKQLKENYAGLKTQKEKDNKGPKFRMDEDDISDVNFNQILEKLPDPDLTLKGRRLFYYFPTPVFEK